MARAWCGIAIDSSVAVECALRGIPFFLCGWLDFMGVGYLRQFASFGVAHVLESPEKIEQIPDIAETWRIRPEVVKRIWQRADPAELELLLFGAPSAMASALCARSPADDARPLDDRQFSATQLPRSRKVV
jgi:hypothetical protein